MKIPASYCTEPFEKLYIEKEQERHGSRGTLHFRSVVEDHVFYDENGNPEAVINTISYIKGSERGETKERPVLFFWNGGPGSATSTLQLECFGPWQMKFDGRKQPTSELTEEEEEFEVCGLRANAYRVNHNVTCYGYSFELDRAGKFDVERARAQEVPMQIWNTLQKGMTIELDGRLYTPDMVMGPDRKGLKVTYCTDTRPTPLITKHAAGSDLFICEGMYGEPDKYEKAVSHKHMTMYEAAEIAKEAEVKQMWLTHYSPSLIKPMQYMDEVRKIFPAAVAGKDRMETTLKFED